MNATLDRIYQLILEDNCPLPLAIHILLREGRSESDVTKVALDFCEDCVKINEYIHDQTAEYVWITPQMAQFFLSRLHPRQRKAAERNISNLGVKMQRSEFGISPDPITFDVNGLLINGQHRLRALINTKQTHRFLIAYNYPEEALFKTIDQNKTRTTCDRMLMRGNVEKNRQLIISTVSAIWRYDTRTWNGRRGPSDDEIENFYLANTPLMNESSSVGKRAAHQKLYGGGAKTPAALYFILRRVNPNAEDFFENFITGANLPQDSPILALRRNLSSSVHSKVKSDEQYVSAITIFAFNHYVSKNPLKIVKWSPEWEMPSPIQDAQAPQYPHQFFQPKN